MNNSDDMTLIEPTLEWRSEFLSMADEFRAEGDARYEDALEDFAAFVRRLHESARGLNLRPSHVAQTTLWLVQGQRLLGSTRLRHSLTPELEHEGGHIGYDIRPTARRRGCGTLMLALTLERARNRGLKSVLLTCDTDNVASARIIEKNGGQLIGQAISLKTGKPISQYRIEL